MENDGVCKLKPEREGSWAGEVNHRGIEQKLPHSAGRSSAEEAHSNTNWDEGRVFSLGWPGLLQG